MQPGSRQRPSQTTALANEAYLRLAEHNVLHRDPGHFVAVAAATIRRVLVDLARDRTGHLPLERDFRFAKAWLSRELKGPASSR